MATPRVLLVTGGLVTPKERSVRAALHKQLAVLRGSSGAWLDVQQKLVHAELVLAARRHRASRAFRRAPYRASAERLFARADADATPELTEVALATLLEAEGVAWDATTWSEVLDGEADGLLERCGVVFASTTLLRDLSELAPLVRRVAGGGRRVVAGGALAGILHRRFEGLDGLDVLAVGYGEHLVPALVRWMGSGFGELEPPPTGSVERRGDTTVVFGGVPDSLCLDWMPVPDWRLAERYHGRRFAAVGYESVRGCPYRCAFCNYPFLFDDQRFRSLSARRIADDWTRLAERGVETVVCLDSLFTMPRRRLDELCALLVERGAPVRWVAYARADDLVDEARVERLVRAGCLQVQIGVESGDAGQLERMDKRCTPEANRRALLACRRVGLTTLATAVLGYPGETGDTVRATLDLFAEAPPDVYFAAVLSTRVEHVPLLDEAHRERFGLETAPGARSAAPYWRHRTMGCDEAGRVLRDFHREMIEGEVALEGSVFYPGMLAYTTAMRPDLLRFQREALAGARLGRRVFDGLQRWVDRRLERDLERVLGPA